MNSTRLLMLPGVAILALLTAFAWAAEDPPVDAAAPAVEQTPAEAPASAPAVDKTPAAPADSDAANAPSTPHGEKSDRMNVLIASLTIFVLAVFVGFELITKVPPTLHTPLMSGSNAISGITIVGALIAAGYGQGVTLVSFVGLLAVILATINAVGGFAVTHRMLAMFQKKKK